VSSITAYSFTHSFETDDETDDSFDIELIDVKTLDNERFRVLPPMDDHEYSGLKAGIEEKGLQEPIHIDEDGAVLDGHYRVDACRELGKTDIPAIVKTGLTEDEKIHEAYESNLQQRHLGDGQKQEVAEQYLTEHWDGDNSGGWQSEVATTLGVSQQTVSNVFGKLRSNGKLTKFGIFSTEQKQQQVRDYLDANPGASNREVAASIEGEVSHPTVGNWREEWDRYPIELDDMEVIHDDFRNVDLEPESVDHIVTNPPYTDDDLELWSDFARFAERVLKPGGYCIAYCGKMFLNDHMARLDEHLDYYWTLGIDLENGTEVYSHQLRGGYRPIVIFQKPSFEAPDDFIGSDLIDGSGREKDDHEWQQSVGEMTTIIEWLTEPGDTVLDPFAGSGTTLIACLETDRRAIGIEKEEEHVDKIHERLEEASDKE